MMMMMMMIIIIIIIIIIVKTTTTTGIRSVAIVCRAAFGANELKQLV